MTLLWTERRTSPSGDERDTKDDNPAKDHDDNDDDKDSVIGTSTSSVTTKQHVKEVPLSWLQSTREELEQERTKRRQLEEQIAQLQQQQPVPVATMTSTRSSQRKRTSTSHKSSNHGVVTTPGPSYQQMVDLQAQVHGYQQIVDALTAGRPAIDFAVRLSVSSAARATSSDASLSSSTSRLVNPYQPLPLHVVRFLEFMPWHPQAMQAAMETEQVLEWQVYCCDKNQWKSELNFFPTFFQALPVIVTGTEGTTKAASSSTGTASHASSIHLAGVWTNQNLTLRLDLTRGCALANNKLGAPTWKWLEDWQVTTANQIKGEDQEEDEEEEDEDHETIMAQYLDQDGWSYATEASHFLLAETSSLPSHYLIDPSSLPPHVLTNESSSASTRSGKSQGSPRTLSLVRRRTWTRRRVLVDYPYASETTVHFLRLLAETRELEVTNQQLQASYQEARLNLANMELRHVHCHRHWVQETATLRARLERAEHEHLEERRRGPPLTRFVPLLPNLTTTTTVAEQDQQGQHVEKEEENATITCPLNLRPESILLNPENGPMSCKATANDHANTGSSRSNPTKGLSFFGWGGNNHNNNNNKDDRKRSSSPAPDVEPCSDCNSVASCEDHDISERSGEDDLSLERFASSPPTEERHKSFLELWFVGKHPALGGGGDKKAVTTNHLDIENF